MPVRLVSMDTDDEDICNRDFTKRKQTLLHWWKMFGIKMFVSVTTCKGNQTI